MKRLIAASLMMLSVALYGQRTGNLPREQITLEECLDMARNNYPQIRELDLIERSRQYELAGISLGWVPRVSLSGKAGWQSEVVELPFEIPGYSFDIPHYQYSVAAEISQQIWDGGASHARKDIVKADAAVRKAQVEVSLYQLDARVQDLYLGILLMDSRLEQNALLRESLERSLEKVTALIEAGMAYRSDRELAEVNLLECGQREAELLADREAYVRMLALFTGKDLSGASFSTPPEVFFSDSMSGRPEMLLYDAQIGQYESQRRQLNSLISPRFAFAVQGAYARPGLNFFDPDFSPYVTIGLTMKWDFGQLYTRRNDIRRIETGTAMVEAEREAFLKNTSAEVIRKLVAIEKARGMLDTDDGIIALCESIRQASEEQFRSGAIRMVDLLDAIDDENEARMARTMHRIQYLMAIYDLKFTLGHDYR